MKWLTSFCARQLAKRSMREVYSKLEASLKPDPDHIRRREAQLPPERVARWRRKRVLG